MFLKNCIQFSRRKKYHENGSIPGEPYFVRTHPRTDIILQNFVVGCFRISILNILASHAILGIFVYDRIKKFSVHIRNFLLLFYTKQNNTPPCIPLFFRPHRGVHILMYIRWRHQNKDGIIIFFFFFIFRRMEDFRSNRIKHLKQKLKVKTLNSNLRTYVELF